MSKNNQALKVFLRSIPQDVVKHRSRYHSLPRSAVDIIVDAVIKYINTGADPSALMDLDFITMEHILLALVNHDQLAVARNILERLPASAFRLGKEGKPYENAHRILIPNKEKKGTILLYGLLLQAVGSEHPDSYEFMRLLVEKGAVVDAAVLARTIVSANYLPPDKKALFYQKIEWMLDLKPELINGTPDEMSLLHQALRSNAPPEWIDNLIQRGADVNKADSRGITPLMTASMINNEDIIRMLLQHGADIDMQSDEGKTPLMYAAERDSIDAIRLLRDAGADAELMTKEGVTAKNYAQTNRAQGALEGVYVNRNNRNNGNNGNNIYYENNGNENYNSDANQHGGRKRKTGKGKAKKTRKTKKGKARKTRRRA